MVERVALEGILVMGLLVFIFHVRFVGFIKLCYLFFKIMEGMIISYVLDMLFIGFFGSW